jgi:predicted dehydrogenase
MTDQTRRIFLGASLPLSVSALSASALSTGRIAGANNRIRIGVVGTGGRGQYLMKSLQRIAPEEVAFPAVCDVYDARRAQAAQLAGTGAEQYLDYRQLVERKDLDAVIVSTPDHWHATVAIAAMQAGKDVYVEKPMVHRPEEGIALVQAARAGKRIVQVGMQGRGLPQFVEAKQRYIDSGVMGKGGFARTWYLSNAGYVQTPPPGFDRKPDGLDWERWTGPGPKVAWNPDIYFSPYKWLYYDGGMIMGIGIHVMDSAHHWMGLRHPVAASAGGGTYFYKDGRDTPDVVTCIFDYAEQTTVTFTAECLSAPGVRTSAGVELRGTGGVLWAERYVQDTGYTYTPNTKFSTEPAARAGGTGAAADVILRDWLDRIRDRKRTIAIEEHGYYSAITCRLAAIAFEKKQRVSWEPAWDLPA